MRLGILFSGGKDSCYAAYLTRKAGHELACLISVFSENEESYMFHTPNIHLVEQQANAMNIPIIIQKTKGEKEKELRDLEKAIKKAKQKYKIEGIVTGAIQSVYQASRVQKICNKLKLECFNPLWQKPELEYLNELIKNRFKIIVTGIFAFPLDEIYLGKKIDKHFIKEFSSLQEKYQINPAGEGGEFGTFVLDCPLYKKPLEIKSKKISGEKNSWRMGVELK